MQRLRGVDAHGFEDAPNSGNVLDRHDESCVGAIQLYIHPDRGSLGSRSGKARLLTAGKIHKN